MRKILLLLFIISTFVGCTKEEDNLPPNLKEISFSEGRIGLGRSVNVSCESLNNEQGLSYKWWDEYGNESFEQVFVWKPTQIGNQKIFVEVTGEGGKTTKESNVDVEYCDLGVAFWGDSPERIMSNETNSLYDMNLNSIPRWLHYTISGENKRVQYYFGGYEALLSGEVLYLSRHNPNNVEGTAQLYYTIWLEERNNLVAKYGNPVYEELIWYTDPDPNQSNWGLAILQYKLECIAKWQTETTEIILRSKKIPNDFLFGEYYSQ